MQCFRWLSSLISIALMPLCVASLFAFLAYVTSEMNEAHIAICPFKPPLIPVQTLTRPMAHVQRYHWLSSLIFIALLPSAAPLSAFLAYTTSEMNKLQIANRHLNTA